MRFYSIFHTKSWGILCVYLTLAACVCRLTTAQVLRGLPCGVPDCPTDQHHTGTDGLMLVFVLILLKKL